MTRWYSARIGEGVILDLRTAVFNHVQKMPIAFFTRTRTGALVSRLNNDVIGAQQAFSGTLSGVVTNLVALILTLIGLRARTAAGTAALSGFTQSTGYLVSAVGPFGIGLLHDLSGGWTVPLVALILVSVPQLVLGLAVSHPSYLEDELPTSRSEGPSVTPR